MSADDLRSDGTETEDGDAALAVMVDEQASDEQVVGTATRPGWPRIAAFRVLPAAAITLGAVAGFLGWQTYSGHQAQAAAEESVAAARETTAAILTYHADSADKDLNAARDRLTGSFLDAYTKLINEVVIPGAKEQKITAIADVPAAATVSAAASHAVALVFVNQSTTVGNDAPTNTASSVKVTLDKVDGRWLVSGFDPV